MLSCDWSVPGSLADVLRCSLVAVVHTVPLTVKPENLMRDGAGATRLNLVKMTERVQPRSSSTIVKLTLDNNIIELCDWRQYHVPE